MRALNKAVLKSINNRPLSRIDIASIKNIALSELLYFSSKIREKYKGNKVKLCSIVNAKSGLCSENCRFCAQSAHNKTKVQKYPYVGDKTVKDAYYKALENKASCFGVVTSGNEFSKKDLDSLCNTALNIKSSTSSGVLKKNGKNANLSVSIGMLDKQTLNKLKSAGINTIHHNLETSKRYFKNICTTHSYSQRVNTVRLAKNMGFNVCSGGLFGLGESFDDRVSLALELRKLKVDSIPLNFLNPVKGTPMENNKRLSVDETLRTIALFRFILPDKDISVCGGREVNLGDFQSWIFMAGANGMMVGGYLTTSGRSVENDLRMIKDAGLEPL